MSYKQLAHYLHYFPLFALFPTIPKNSQQANLSWHAIFWQILVGLPLTGRPWLVCYAIGWQTFAGMSLAVRPSLACHAWADLGWHTSFPADLGCETNDWHSLVAMLFFGRAWLVCYWLAGLDNYALCNILLNYALQAACPLFAVFPTICTIPNYLHYF